MNVKDNRSFWFYLLLTFLTCGLYSIYFWYVYVEDLNTIFYGDGEDSPNYIIVLLLSWVTCGFTAFTGVTNRRTACTANPTTATV